MSHLKYHYTAGHLTGSRAKMPVNFFILRTFEKEQYNKAPFKKGALVKKRLLI
jgi:hypothetical protein